MIKNLVLIPSSRYVDKEMQIDVGEIPPVLIPAGNKPLIQTIIDNYKNLSGECDFFIVSNQGKELLKSFISRKRQEESIELIEVPLGLDLGQTILNALKQINISEYNNLIINFGDTIVGDKFSLDKDSVFYDLLQESFRWTTFEEKDGKIKKITDKLVAEHVGLNKVFVGLFLIKDINFFINCLETYKKTKDLDSFYSSLLCYLSKKDYDLVKANQWYDYGHIDNYYKAKKRSINTRFFNKIDIDEHKAIIRKTSENIDSFLGEIKWYLELPSSLRHYIPQIFDYSLHREEPFIEMEYYGYPSLSDLYLFSGHSLGIWNHIFNSIFLFIEEMKKYQLKETPEKINQTLKEIYCDKTFNRLNELRKDYFFQKYFDNEIIINSKKYNPLNYYITKIESLYNKLIVGKIPYLTIIHGDLCLANILYDPKNRIIKVIDPRGKFGRYTIYGDFRYELAKLSHSFNGNYESIINDSFFIEYKENKIDYRFFLSDKQNTISQMFNKRLLKEYPEHIDAINFIESLLFLSMLPLHKDHKERQLVMLATGLEKINLIVEKLKIKKKIK